MSENVTIPEDIVEKIQLEEDGKVVQDALEMLRSSLPLKNEIYGEYSENVADTYKHIASVHLAQGNIEKTLRVYKKCLNIETLVLGKNHKKTKDSERTIDILMARRVKEETEIQQLFEICKITEDCLATLLAQTINCRTSVIDSHCEEG